MSLFLFFFGQSSLQVLTFSPSFSCSLRLPKPCLLLGIRLVAYSRVPSPVFSFGALLGTYWYVLAPLVVMAVSRSTTDG
ncbi:hypothetical protein IF2G_02037 [Cordyceps javanica]|nr:hypothetical protein IF2G_02037 [Cordyceps javanica]